MPQRKIARYILAVLLLVVALNAFGGGWYGMAGAKDVPTAWLEGSPFDSYLIPAAVLFVVVGGTSLLASILTFANSYLAKRAATIAGLIMLLWIGAQITIIGYVSWLQPAIAGAGILTLLLAQIALRKS